MTGFPATIEPWRMTSMVPSSPVTMPPGLRHDQRARGYVPGPRDQLPEAVEPAGRHVAQVGARPSPDAARRGRSTARPRIAPGSAGGCSTYLNGKPCRSGPAEAPRTARRGAACRLPGAAALTAQYRVPGGTCCTTAATGSRSTTRPIETDSGEPVQEVGGAVERVHDPDPARRERAGVSSSPPRSSRERRR